jgi:hypothetical protein
MEFPNGLVMMKTPCTPKCGRQSVKTQNLTAKELVTQQLGADYSAAKAMESSPKSAVAVNRFLRTCEWPVLIAKEKFTTPSILLMKSSIFHH